VVICLEQGAHLHMAQLMPLPFTISCFSKIQTGFTFLVPVDPGSPGKGPLNGCVCVCLNVRECHTPLAAWKTVVGSHHLRAQLTCVAFLADCFSESTEHSVHQPTCPAFPSGRFVESDNYSAELAASVFPPTETATRISTTTKVSEIADRIAEFPSATTPPSPRRCRHRRPNRET